MTVKPEETNQQPKLDGRFITNIKGRDFVLYAGLLDLAHQKGLKSINVEAIQYPTKENGMEAICKATIESLDGREFIEIGDANPKNVNQMVKEHVLRLSATRSKSRALRDYTNIGMTCLEELGDIDQVVGDESNPSALKGKKNSPKPNPKKENKPDERKDKTTANKEEAQKTANSTTEKEDRQDQPEQSNVSTLPGRGPKMSNAQKKAILNLAKRRGITENELIKMVEEAFNSNLDYLSSSEASSFIRQLQQAA